MRSFSPILACLLLLLSLMIFPIASNPVLAPSTSSAFAERSLGVQENVSFGSYMMIQYPLPDGSASPWSIAVDDSGRVWFVQQGPSALVMFNPDTRNYTRYLIPSIQNVSATPESVTIDKSGNVWFSELTTDKLGELKNGSDSLEQYSIPGSFVTVASTKEALPCGPTIVKSDPVGNIWIACDFANQIAEFFPGNHTFFSYNLPLWQSAPAGFVFDNQGNLWFTAADADMIGHAVLSDLVNGTDKGINEFPPINSTYTYTFPHPISLGGQPENLTSSLPTPSGIALGRDGITLWITEHVDSSFDSYNVDSHSLVKYWTSQTYDEYGYSVSFPNGIAIDEQGNVWISEHYGNKIAEFLPATGQLYEYPIPHYGGPYNLALGPNRTVWFVEIAGAAIGELKPTNTNTSVIMNLHTPTTAVAAGSSISIPLTVTGVGGVQSVSFNISGTSDTGILSGLAAHFEREKIVFSSSGQSVNDTLSISVGKIKTGIYYLTLSATDSSSGEIYSNVLKLSVQSGDNLAGFEFQLIVASVIASIAVVAALYLFVLRSQRRPRPAKSKVKRYRR